LPQLPRRLDEAGPLVGYINWLATLKDPAMPALAKEVQAAVTRVFNTPDGQVLMDLLEKATLQYALHPLSDARACEALNAQRQIALDLRRIVSNDGRDKSGPSR
jgi:hypothetical protein